MSEHELEESLSALMDGELPPDEARRVLDAVLEDPALRARWAAWQRVGAALAGQHPARSGDLAARVQAALEGEPRPAVRTPPVAAPVPPAPVRPRRGHGARRVLALAASGAAVAVLVAVVATRERTPPAPLARAPATHDAPPGPLARAPDAQPAPPEPLPQAPASHGAAASQRMAWDDAGPAVSRRLNAYLLNHNDYLSGGVRGLLAYARVVGYDGDE